MPGRAKIEKIGGQGNGQDAWVDISEGEPKTSQKSPHNTPFTAYKKPEKSSLKTG